MPSWPQSQTPQRGGSIAYVNREMVPEATSPAAMEAAVDFFLVSAHGAANLQQLMIVPENTFVVFLAHSGFVRYMRNELKKFVKLLNPMGYLPERVAMRYSDPAWIEAKTKWREEYYKTFFTGESKSLKFYPGASVYGPGDILPDTQLIFRSGAQEVWIKGVYSLPIHEKEVHNFTLEKNLVYILADWVKDGTLTPEYIHRVARILPLKLKEFYDMVFESDEVRRRKYGVAPRLEEWFENTEAITREFFDPILFYKAEDNLATTAPIDGTHLSRVLANIQSPKRYRFFFFTGCRAPMFGADEENTNNTHPNRFRRAEPLNIPLNIPDGMLRRMTRRFSVSSRCYTGRKPALNLAAVRIALVMLLADEASMKRLTAGHLFNSAYVISFLKRTLFGSAFQFVPSITASQFAMLLDHTFEEISPEVAAEIPLYVELIKELRETFGEFIVQLRREGPKTNTADLTVGQLYMAAIGIAPSFVRELAGPNIYGKRPGILRAEGEMRGEITERELANFRKSMDEVLKKYSDGYGAFKTSVEKYLRSDPTIQADVERNYSKYMELGEALQKGFETEQEKVFQKFRHLTDAQKDYRMSDSMDLIDSLDNFEDLLKPLQELINRLVSGPPASASRRASRGGAQTRRLRVRRR